MPIILAVDPGKTVGSVLADGASLLWTREDSTAPFLDLAFELLSGAGAHRPGAVVCEAYNIVPGSLSKTRGENWNLEQIGALRWMSRHFGTPFVLQQPSAVLALVTNDRLRALDLYVTGGHSRDAARHLVYYLARQKEIVLK